MATIKARRLSKIARELNIGITTITEFLNSIGYKIESNPNTKISNELYDLLLKEFSYYVDQKKKSDEIRIQKSNDLDATKNHSTNDLLEANINSDVSSNDLEKDSILGKLNIGINEIVGNKLTQNNPKVFLSYSWDNEEHKIWVEKFARVLMSNGIVTILDQYELSIGDNLQHFMEKHIPDVDKVIIILTPNYKTKADNKYGGVGFEYSIITQELFNNQTSNKFVPVQRLGELEECVPTFLKSRLFLDMRTNNQFKSGLKQIIYNVYNKRMIEKPELGKVPDFKELNFNL